MAKKKEGTSFQIEIRGEPQWRQLCRKDGLIVVDVYPGWTGHCVSIVNFLKRVKQDIAEKHETYSNKLTFATACSDKIEDLLIFKDHSEPTWLFLTGGGKPVRVFKGSHVPNLAKAINEEFEHELLCMEGKARRNVISIDDDETRKKKFEAEAQRLADMLTDEEEPSPDIENARRDSSVLLETVMSAYTIGVIQPFILNEIAEIKEYLSGEFNILGQANVKIDDEAARRLYRIPFEVEDPTQEVSRKSEDVDPTEETDMEKPPSPPKKKVPVILPQGVVGETMFLLLESTEIKNILESGGKPSGALQTADDWLRLKVGPRIYEQAVEHSPNSLHATYGKGEYMSGVWCPRRYDDKRHILLTYFPQFLVEKVLPFEIGEEYVPKRYVLLVYPGAKSKDITDTIKNNETDVFAHGRMKIPPEVAEKMAKSSDLPEEEVEKKKHKLLGGTMLCVSVNRRNEALFQTLQGMTPAPLHFSVDPVAGANETAALFPNLNAKYEEDADEVLQKYAARAKKRIPDKEKPDTVEEVEPEPELESETMEPAEPEKKDEVPQLSSAVKVEKTEETKKTEEPEKAEEAKEDNEDDEENAEDDDEDDEA